MHVIHIQYNVKLFTRQVIARMLSSFRFILLTLTFFAVGYVFLTDKIEFEVFSKASVPFILHRLTEKNTQQTVQKPVQNAFKKTSIQKSSKTSISLPNTSILFLKTHKTGSSTIQNILYRLVDTRDLSVAIPCSGKHSLQYPSPFKYRSFKTLYARCFPDEEVNRAKFDIVCNHARYSEDLQDLLISDNKFLFTVLRSPASLIKSSFSYFFKDVSAFEEAGTLSKFLEHPERYWNTTSKMWWFARNGMSFDLGYEKPDALDPNFEGTLLEDHDNFIKNLEQKFDFVMITEYMDHGLLVLKKMLNLSFDDIVYMTANKNLKAHDKFINQTLLKLQNDFAENFASLDLKLYKHFNTTFWKTVDIYGVSEEELELFRRHRENVFKRCFRDTVEFNRNNNYLNGKKMKKIDREFHPWSPPGQKIQAYTFTEKGENSEFCRSLIRPEVSYAQRLRVKQGLAMEGKVIMDGFYNKILAGVEGLEDEMADLLRLPRDYNVRFL